MRGERKPGQNPRLCCKLKGMKKEKSNGKATEKEDLESLRRNRKEASEKS